MIPMIFSLVFGVTVLALLIHGILRGSTFIRWLCILLLLLLFFGALMPWPRPRSREMARRTLCMSNLHQIGLAARMYQQDHSNAFPHSILDLTNDLAVPKLFVCKSAGHEPGALTNLLGWTSYVCCFPPGTNQVLAYCPLENHKGQGGNILFTDGSVRWFRPEEFTNTLEKGRQGAPTTP